MDAAIQRIVRRASVISAGLGFALAPVPTADGVAMLPVQAVMFVAIARARGRRLRDVPWFGVVRATVAASVVRSAANLSLRQAKNRLCSIMADHGVRVGEDYEQSKREPEKINIVLALIQGRLHRVRLLLIGSTRAASRYSRW